MMYRLIINIHFSFTQDCVIVVNFKMVMSMKHNADYFIVHDKPWAKWQPTIGFAIVGADHIGQLWSRFWVIS